MKHLRTFENFNQTLTNTSEYPSLEDMKAYVCGCGYNEMEVEEMSYSQVCNTYDKCKMEMNEARKYKRKQADKKTKNAKPDFLDLDKDGDKKETMKKAYSDKKAAQGKGAQKDKDEAQKKSQSQAQGKLSAAQKKLPPALQKAIMNKKK